MIPITDDNGNYRTGDAGIGAFARAFPSLSFYLRGMCVVFSAAGAAKADRYDSERWVADSLKILRLLEDVGVKAEVTGADNITAFDGPCVFVANHMSTLETFVLPCLIRPIKRVTFVVKDSLLSVPIFNHIIRARDPITVSRTDPRADLKAVFEGGQRRLGEGTSLIIFPQTTRARKFEPEKFNSLGIKLARRAGVPVVPIALKTDAWGTGSVLKEFGPVDPSIRVHIEFGKHLLIEGRGSEEHHHTVEFIGSRLKEWGGED